MDLRFASDIHLELDRDSNQEALQKSQVKARGPNEVLMVAGDLVPAVYLEPNRKGWTAGDLKKRTAKFLEDVSDYKHVYFIGGNHDSYHGDILATQEIFNDFLMKQGIHFHHMRFLEDASIELVQGTWLLCCSLWMDMDKGNPMVMEAVKYGMNDFRLIHKGDRLFTPGDAAEIHRRSLNYLSENYEKRKADGKTKIIIATHHAPSFQSVRDSPRHGGPLDFAYYSDLEDWILDRPQITHLIHGHTHHNCRYKIGNTEVVVNCRGYGMPGYEDQGFGDFSVENGCIHLQ
jgi:UDP-2,3-diacylglucosamine pyrophosphatase LpxH